MKRTLAFVAVTLLAFACAGRVLAQNPLVGTWKLNVAKSKYNPGPAPKSMTRTVEADGDKVKYTFEGVAADGSPVSYSFTVAVDGKDYPITGATPSGADAISVKQTGSKSSEATFKKAGKPILIAKVRISADGKVTTITQASAPGAGSVNNTLIFEKQ
jgi:hypothetical protein